MWLALTLIFFVARLGFDAQGRFQRGGKLLIATTALSLAICRKCRRPTC